MSKSRARKFNVGGGWEVQIQERARGQETAYFVAAVYKDGAEVGTARNSGTGGATMYHPWGLDKQLEQLLDAEAVAAGIEPAKLGKFERADIVFHYALAKTARNAATLQLANMTLHDFLHIWVR